MPKKVCELCGGKMGSRDIYQKGHICDKCIAEANKQRKIQALHETATT